jgi:hypothetical protein
VTDAVIFLSDRTALHRTHRTTPQTRLQHRSSAHHHHHHHQQQQQQKEQPSGNR